MHTKSLIVSVFILFGCVCQSFGQENRKEVCVVFRTGNGTLDTAYKDNAGRLSEIVSFLLAEERRRALENYVRERVSLPDSIVTRRDDVTAWEHLARLVEQSDMPHKEERKSPWTPML